jgi:hypothetical protein
VPLVGAPGPAVVSRPRSPQSPAASAAGARSSWTSSPWAWARRHPSAKEADIQADRSHDRGELALDQAARLAPLGDLASYPRVVRRTVDPNGAISFAGRYYAVRCVSGVVQLILDGELVRAWRQRHTPEREQRMLQRPNPQQRTANARPLTSRRPTRPG